MKKKVYVNGGVMKRYRVYVDVDAHDEDEAGRLGLKQIDDLNMEVYELKFTDSEMTTIKELARIALADGEIFDDMVEQLDILDADMKALQEKIELDMAD